MLLLLSCWRGEGTVTQQSKRNYSHTHTHTDTENLTYITHAPSHDHTCVNRRLEEGAMRREEDVTERNEACATLEVLVASVVLASQLPRMQRVTCDNNLLAMVHTLSSLPPDEQQMGESRE